MLFLRVAFGACLLLLLAGYAVLAAAQRKGDREQVHVLHFFRVGLSLSALSYLLRLTDAPHHGLLSFLGLLTCLLGTAFIWLGWVEHWKLRWERLHAPAARTDEGWDESEAEQATGEAPFTIGGKDTSRLNTRTRQVLLHAGHEAHRRHEHCVDTDHLLLGLLRDPRSAGVHILEVLGASPEKVHLELLGQMASCRKFARLTPDVAPRAPAGPPALTDHADQVLALAAQEAHRFDKATVGTEHLLLGLVLVGKGKAAAVLFAEGVTVDGIRDEIIKAKKAA